jgi:voltage-gated potassium channel Kch
MTKKSRIVIAGGSGRVGTRVAELLMEQGHSVVVADRAPGRLPTGAEFKTIDARRPETLVDVFAAATAVVNTIGPYDRWGSVVLDAAIAAGAPYVDVCDDPHATELLLARDADARSAGVPALVGLGSTPGMSNLLAVIAARQLAECRDLVVFWGASRDEVTTADAEELAASWAAFFRKGRAAVTHFFEQITGAVPVWRSGTVELAHAWAVPVHVRTSDGRGGTYRLVGHPEPVTLPRSLRGPSVYCLGTCGAPVDEVLATVARSVESGSLSIDEAGAAVAELLARDPLALVATTDLAPIESFVGVLAQGSLDGHEQTVVVLPGGPTNGSLSVETARPTVVALDLLAGVPAGVHPPEAALDAEAFMQAYSQRFWQGADPYAIDRQPGSLVDPDVFAPEMV